MLNMLDTMYIKMMGRINESISEFQKEEQGVSNVVATIIMILIVVLLCAAFYGAITGWFSDLWVKITINGESIKPTSF